MENFVTYTILALLPGYLLALGGEPEVVSGLADYEKIDSHETIHVKSDKAILQYKTFNLDLHETTTFKQPSAKSTLLCRIKGKEPSVLRGRLEANGKLLFINPNGIIFSEKAHVNVGTLIASTLDIQNDDFLNDKYRFSLSSDSRESSIVHKGEIYADHHVILMAPHIHNEGVIGVKTGTITLGGGEITTLDFDGDQKISFAIEAPFKQGMIEQGGHLLASEVYMKMPMAQRAIKSVLNTNGTVEADRIEIKDGVIHLMAKGEIEAKTLHIEGGTVKIDEALKVEQLNINAQEIVQKATVSLKGPVSYKASQILIGDDITTQGENIILDGPIVLIKNDAIRFDTGYIKGDVICGSLDADRPSRALTVQTGNGRSVFTSDIGKNGPFRDLTLNSREIVFQGSIGDLARPGLGRLHIEKSLTVDCQGSIYHTKEQLWRAVGVHLTYPGAVIFKTGDLPLCFGEHASIFLEKTTAFTVDTQGGLLDLAPIIIESPQPVTIRTGNGDAYVKQIRKKATDLSIEGRDILLAGQLEGENLFLEADRSIRYNPVQDSPILRTSIRASKKLILNAKHGILGSADTSLRLQAPSDCFVGAKTVAYLGGRCADYVPHVYPPNPPPRFFFNGFEYNYLFIEDFQTSRESQNSLTPALGHKTATSFLEEAVIQPRSTSIYYESSQKVASSDSIN